MSVSTADLTLERCREDKSTLDHLLSLLFEPTPTLHDVLTPSVFDRLKARPAPKSYEEIVDVCQAVGAGWKWEQKAEFVHGHPMIGAPKVTGLSGKEQGGGGSATSQVVLDRLAHLNEVYCAVYPGLRYITFVNGRPRSAIVPEMEKLLNLPRHSLREGEETDQPAINSQDVKGRVKDQASDEWKRECDRCISDVWEIGRARLKTLELAAA